MKQIAITIIAVLILGCCGCSTQHLQENDSQYENESLLDNSHPTGDLESLSDNKKSVLSQDEEVVRIIEENFSDIAYIQFDDETQIITITPYDVSFTDEVILALNGDERAKKSWNALVDVMTDLSERILDVSPGYSIAIINPTNSDSTFLFISDGIIFYDVVSD
ncbi:hypothetical protein JR334_07755 [Clostridia bacterium]|nr:hypothetical protein JR334_07755 [Clostridia bacterium]